MSRPWIRRTLAAAAAVVLTAASLSAFVEVGLRPPPRVAQAHRIAPTPTAPPATPTPTATPVPPNPAAERLTPGTLVIPKIGVQATVEQVTVDGNGDMAVPQKVDDVGWYAPGVAPGQAGDAVIDGHLDWYGVPEAVFFRLDQLQPGDEVDVISQGNVTLHFAVTDSSLVSATDRPAGVFATTGPPRLTLITCAGDYIPAAGGYNERLLVDASYSGMG